MKPATTVGAVLAAVLALATVVALALPDARGSVDALLVLTAVAVSSFYNGVREDARVQTALHSEPPMPLPAVRED